MFLQKDIHCNFSDNSPCIITALKATYSKTTTLEKVNVIMHLVQNRIKYDYIRSFTQKTIYEANIDETWRTNKGLCLDIAGVVCAMCRACNIQCKICIGYADKVYHAWNQILINGVWKIYDATARITGMKYLKYTPDKFY